MMTPTRLILMILTKSPENAFEQNLHVLLNVVKVSQLSLENIQRHRESICFGLFLNLIISGTPHLGELIFWIYINNTKHNI